MLRWVFVQSRDPRMRGKLQGRVSMVGGEWGMMMEETRVGAAAGDGDAGESRAGGAGDDRAGPGEHLVALPRGVAELLRQPQ